MPELPEYDLLVAGSGEYRDELERVTEEVGVDERVKFLGYVDDEQLPKLYSGATIYLLLSEFEAYGMTVAEALASGTPCVVRTGSALDDWLANPGVVGVDDVSSRAVIDAIQNAHKTDFGGTQVVGWDAVVDGLETRYR